MLPFSREVTLGKTHSVKIRPSVGCYKETLKNGVASPMWYSRIHLQIGDKKVHIRSTRTTDLREAIKRTEEYYFE